MAVSETVLQLQVEGYRAMSPARKLAIAWGLRRFAWDTKAAALRVLEPEAAEAEVRRRVAGWFAHERS
ncbi:MAG: hypothetical protein SGJ01_05030 [Gemmatimonadota bacterium]|nr:hypothetical protein [Gemmatimonadota bacterium]